MGEHETRAERRRQQRLEARGRHKPPRLEGPSRAGVVPDADYGVQPGWFQALQDLEEAKRISHDALVEQMGDSRTGPVQWRWWTGADARDQLNILVRGGGRPLSQHEADYYRRIGGHLREYGGFLIIALAQGQPDG